MAVTIHEVGVGRGIKEDEHGSINAGEYLSRGLPFIAGCEVCGATLAPYNAHPSKSGYTRCEDCLGEAGFETVAEFEAFDAAGDTNPPRGVKW